MIEERIRTHIDQALRELGGEDTHFIIEHPNDIRHGDYSTNVALVAARKLGTIPRALAGQIADKIILRNDTDIASVEVAGAGFINIRLTDAALIGQLKSISGEWGRTDEFVGKQVIVEYTDPNPFKEFHIGHLLPNSIGESLSRLIEWGGAEVKRANYQGDVGMHVAKAIWGIENLHSEMPKEEESILLKAKFLGRAYAKGAEAYEQDETAKGEIAKMNKKIYEKGDPLIDALYENGKRWSLEYFEHIYQLLGTKFDYYFFESITAPLGKEVVVKNIGKVFEQSQGAVIFPGEKYGLHTRVFINSEGLPTYETKEIGLAELKYQTYPYDLSYVVTANEVVDYFKVLLEVMGLLYNKQQLKEKTRHIAHGMMRLTNGKISSRKGNVPTVVDLIDEAKEELKVKISSERGFTDEEKEVLARTLAVAAVKFSILRQEIGHDIIFDFQESLSFEGDSGPYLEYTYARIASLLKKAPEAPLAKEFPELGVLPRMLVRFPEYVTRAQKESAPHHVLNYLIQIAREFNSYYGNTTILSHDNMMPYHLMLTRAVGHTLRNGLTMLGIPVVESM
jgi:arginyl-tRNA synthetase